MADRITAILLIGLVAVWGGCRTAHQIRDPEFAQVAEAAYQACCNSHAVVATANPFADDLSGPHPVETYIQYSLAQNANVQAARKRVEAAAMRVPQAASLKDPMLSVTGWPFNPYVPQQAAGRVTAEAMISQEVPWFGKLNLQAQAAEKEADMARAQLAATELEVIEQVSRSYYQLYFIEQSIRITEENRNLLTNVMDIVDVRYKTSRASQQDLLRVQADVSSADSDLIRLRQELDTARADLALLLHVSPETLLQTSGELATEDVPRDIELLYAQAITARPELHEQLAAVERDRYKVDRARLEYFPDVTVGASWGAMTTNRAISPVADGLDMYGLNISGNLPVYRHRLDAGVREAEAQAVASAREYDRVRDQTLRDVKNLFSQANSQSEMARLLRDSIIPKTEQALRISIREYEVGTTSFVQVIDNRRELLRLRIMHQQLESQLRQTIASLQRVVGGIANSAAESVPVPESETMVPPAPPA